MEQYTILSKYHNYIIIYNLTYVKDPLKLPISCVISSFDIPDKIPSESNRLEVAK